MDIRTWGETVAARFERDKPTVTLYDQFGRPVYVPSSAPKIGDTITVKWPEWMRFRDGKKYIPIPMPEPK